MTDLGDSHPRGSDPRKTSSSAGSSRAGASNSGERWDRHLASLFSPPRQRRVLEALCGIENEVNASLRPGLDHHVAHTRLQWWREECARTAEGKPLHPVTRDLVEAYAPAPLGALQGLSGLIDAATWDLAAATFETRRELTAYCERWSAAMIETAAAPFSSMFPARVFPTSAPPVNSPAPNSAPVGGQVARAPTAAPAASAAPSRAVTPGALPSRPNIWRNIGVAIREIEMLCNLSTEANYGRVRVPLDELERAGVTPDDVRAMPSPPALAALLRARHEALRASLVASVNEISPEERPETRGLLVWASAAWRISLRAQRMLPRMMVAQPFAAVADTWHAWRAARYAMTGRSVFKPT